MSEIYEDTWEEGEGKYTGCGATWAIGRNFPNIPTMLTYLKAHHNLSDELVDYHQDKQKEDDEFERWTLQTTKTVADHSEAQNGGWMEPTKDEYESWKKGELMLYAEHYIIYYHEVKNTAHESKVCNLKWKPNDLHTPFGKSHQNQNRCGRSSILGKF